MEYVYIVKKNSDFTEGRGPMLFHLAFANGEDAIAYVEKQPGIYGSQQKVERGKYGYYAYANGYEISEVRLYNKAKEVFDKEQKDLKKAALAKLNKKELAALRELGLDDDQDFQR